MAAPIRFARRRRRSTRARGDRSRTRPDVAVTRAEGLALPLDSGNLGGGNVLEEAAAMLGTT